MGQEEVPNNSSYGGSSEQKHQTILIVLDLVKAKQKALSFNLGFIWVKHKCPLLIIHTYLSILSETLLFMAESSKTKAST